MLALITALVASASAFAAPSAKTYQVTGPVTAINADTISVQKGSETWLLARDGATQVSGATDVKVGDKVTVQYAMRATEIVVKGPGAAGADAAKKTKK